MTTTAPLQAPVPSPPVPDGTPAQRPRRSVPRTLLMAPFRSATWRAFGYLLVRIPLAGLAFVLVPALVVSAGLSLTVVGIPLVALVVLAGRGVGAVQRGVTRTVLHRPMPDPAGFQPRPGLLGRLGSALGDLVGWRAIVYVLASFPVVLVGGYAVLIWIGTAVGCLTYPVWAAGSVSSRNGPDGWQYEGLQLAGWHADTWAKALLVAGFGLVVLWCAPWLLRGVVAVDLLLQRWLLTGTAADRRVAALQAARADIVEDAAATLRRVERDLHDGTQAQLVAVAMTLDRARSRLVAGDADGAAALLDGAHGAAKEALTDLREVVRRIHPPVLDQGLTPALATLAARCALPVALTVEVPVRPGPGVETIAYFCVAELLTNAVRHSGARAVEVTVRGDGRAHLAITVRDDGQGGAEIVADGNGAVSNGVVSNGAVSNGASGSGLAGLAQRVRAVDGRLSLDSPAGGPTVVQVLLPAGGAGP